METAESKENGNNNNKIDCVQGNEILSIGVGQAGVYLLNEFYSTIMDEHKIDKDGKFIGNWNKTNDRLLMLKYNVYFNDDDNKYIPRAIFSDTDKTTINDVRSSYIGPLLQSSHFWSSGYSEPQIIWAKGHYTAGGEYIDKHLEIIRKAIERCNNMQGFQFFHSIGGGWGSGFANLLQVKMRDYYPDKCVNCITIYPSNYGRADVGINHQFAFEIYNSILSIFQLIENCDLSYTFENGKLFQIADKKLKLKHPTYNDINYCLSQVLSGVTSTLRFHAEPAMHSTMKSIGQNLILFPRLHFFTLNHTPFLPKITEIQETKNWKPKCNATAIIEDLFSPINDVSHISLWDGKILDSAVIYRGSNEDALSKMREWTMKFPVIMADDFVTWIPDSVQSTFVYDGDNHCYEKYTPIISTTFIHTTAIKSVYQRLSAQFAKQYKRKAYLHWYKNEGMDEMEFQEADKNVRDLITEYQDKQDAVVELEWDDYDYSDDDYDDESDMS